MKPGNLWRSALLYLLILPFSTEAQKSIAQKPDAAADEKKVREIVSFFQYMLNSLGNSTTSSRDKDVLITESYSKIFRDGKVQVEDDLDEDRDVITNKDIVAYLKDVDFFFKDVKFDFTIEEIEKSTLPDGDLFYKVKALRNLSGTTTDLNQVNNTVPRYIEVNYDPENRDLKIVSVYTHKFNEKKALTTWWDQLSYEWQSIFRRSITTLEAGVYSDSVSLDDIKSATSITELDLSNNSYIQSLEPLSQLLDLRTLNLSGTSIEDLTPIRNLTELRDLNISQTNVGDLSPIKYTFKLNHLDISQTKINDISIVQKMSAMEELKMANTEVSNFSPLSYLTKATSLDLKDTPIKDLDAISGIVNLKQLNVSGTSVQDLSPLKTLDSLMTLNIDSTNVKNLGPLKNLKNLKVLYANKTLISDLEPLAGSPSIERIYCDQTLIKKEQADLFIKSNPGALVIFDSKDLKAWWDTLLPSWQNILLHASRMNRPSESAGNPPTKEELAKIKGIDSVNIEGNAEITNLEPLRKLQNLKRLNASYTPISDLSPIEGCRDLEYLDISGTSVKDISLLTRFQKLTTLKADKSEIKNIDYYSFPVLEVFYADHTTVHDYIARDFLRKNPNCLLIYKTIHLDRWWGNLNENWKDLFKKSWPDLARTTLNETRTGPTRENMHRLVELEVLKFNEAYVSDLTSLSEFVRLKELHFSGTAIAEIPPLESLRLLKSLHATNSPLKNISSIRLLTQLEDLDISNSPIEDLDPISELINLKKVNCSGTQVKKLNSLEHLANLESLDCSNTKVRKLDPLGLIQLGNLKCYNTRISSREMEYFMKIHPDCTVVYY